MEQIYKNRPFAFDDITEEEYAEIIHAVNDAFPVVKVRDLVYDYLVPEFSFYAYRDSSERLTVQVYAWRLELDERWVMRKIKSEFQRRQLLNNARLAVACNRKQVIYMK